jgi:hypothetical protein
MIREDVADYFSPICGRFPDVVHGSGDPVARTISAMPATTVEIALAFWPVLLAGPRRGCLCVGCAGSAMSTSWRSAEELKPIAE